MRPSSDRSPRGRRWALYALLAAAPLPALGTNVLVILADDVGVDKVSGFADYTNPYDETESSPSYLPDTPTLSDLQAAGVSFTQAWANAECSPTRASFNTGRHAFVNEIGQAMPMTFLGIDDATTLTLGETASKAGVNTAWFGKWHLGVEGSAGTTDWQLSSKDADTTLAEFPNPARHGWRTYVGDLTGPIADFNGWTRVTFPGSGGPGAADLHWETENADDVVVDEALDWIGAQTGPWLGVVAFYSAHVEMDKVPFLFDEGEVDEASCAWDPCIAAGTCTDLDRTVYRDMVECMDTRIETLLDGIAPEVLDDTVIVFFADNGTRDDEMEGLYASAGGRESNGKSTVYETGVHVPLIVADGRSWNTLRGADTGEGDAPVFALAGSAVDVPVMTIDLHDTVADALGLDTHAMTLASRSLWPFLNGAPGALATLTHQGVYTEFFNTSFYSSGLLDGASAAAYRRGDWKLVLNVDSTGLCYNPELFDLSTDPFEQIEVHDVYPGLVDLYTDEIVRLGPTWLPADRCP